MIQVCFFASLRERTGISETQVSAEDVKTIKDVWAVVTDGADIPDKLLAACNHEYAPLEALVSEGDEIGFFPPVTGG